MQSYRLRSGIKKLKKYTRYGSTRHQDHWNAFVSTNAHHYSENPQLHEMTSDGSRGLLTGIPIAVKDSICTMDMMTTCSSAMLKDFTSPFDATVVSLLRRKGAHIVGKTNCDEFGMGSHNIHSVHGPVVNPYQIASMSEAAAELRSAGGSSGGSAAAVAGGLCYAALSTDTGGSTRLPASYCGIAGLKPSYGLISRWGVISFADSLDCVGILAKSSGDIGPVFDALNVYDPKDPTSALPDIRDTGKRSTSKLMDTLSDRRLKDLRIGVPEECFPAELNPASIRSLSSLIKNLRAAGADVRRIALPNTRYALSAYYVIASAEASSNLARYSGVHYGTRVSPPSSISKKRASDVYSHTRSKGFGHEVQKRILLGSYALSADAFDNYFLQAQRVRKLVCEDFQRVLRHKSALSPSSDSGNEGSGVDFLLYPTAVGTAPLLEDAQKMSELEAYLQDALTVPTSLAGLPTLSVPAGTGEDGWPLGVSVTGQWGFDDAVLKFGEIIESLTKCS